MPDICKCEGGDCPLKESCLRYMIRPLEINQAYFLNPPFKEGKCNHYWEIKEEEDEISS